MACTSTGANDRRRNQYAKILGLDALTSKIAERAEEYHITGLRSEADEKFGFIPVGDFMTTVDLEHPHVWLSHYTEAAEARFAFVVTRLLGEMPRALEDCKTFAYAAGRAGAESEFRDMEQAYVYYTQNVLDGMPCDTTAVIRSQTDTEIVWEKVLDTHAPLWQQIDGNVDNYYAVMEAYIEGLFAESEIRFAEEDHKMFRLYRKG